MTTYNQVFDRIRMVLAEDGPSTGDHIRAELAHISPDAVTEVLRWAVDNESLTFDGGVYALTERGRR